MPTQTIHESRIKKLNDLEPKRERHFVLYSMESTNRTQDNHALEYAVQQANELGKRLLVLWPLFADAFGSHRRQKHFLLQGIRDVEAGLRQRRIKFAVVKGGQAETTLSFAKDAALVVLDRGYLRHHVAWRDEVAAAADVPVIEVESDVVVPIETASDKREHAARTIRPKITRQMNDYLVELEATPIKKDSLGLTVDSVPLDDLNAVLDDLGLPGGFGSNGEGVGPVPLFVGGEAEAKRRFRAFLQDRFHAYSAHRNQPQTSDCSYMSMYLHFGMVSPVWLAMQAKASGTSGGQEDRDDFLEELVVRRELAINFCAFGDDYDAYDALPNFARQTLEEHASDPREHVYTAQQLEDAQTHDPYWNAAMRELRYTGYMHNYMRMYWGKKVLEWTRTPRYAFKTLLHLNDKYFLDGRDPNSYTGVSWCFGTHDRGWTERPIFGKVRYMNANGLKRKCDPEAYVAKVDALVAEVGGPTAHRSRTEGSLFSG
ncbi:MAG: deoxyribodipyrimidine photo-lyase [Planctomycetota bacterium]